MMNQDTACMIACCHDNKEGHLPANVAKSAIFPFVRETDFASFFQVKEREKSA